MENEAISWVCCKEGNNVLCVCEHNGAEVFQHSRSAAKTCLRFEKKLEDYFCEMGAEAEEWPEDLVNRILGGKASLCRLTDGEFPGLSAVGLGSTKEKRVRAVAVALIVTASIANAQLPGAPDSLDDLAPGLDSIVSVARETFPSDGTERTPPVRTARPQRVREPPSRDVPRRETKREAPQWEPRRESEKRGRFLPAMPHEVDDIDFENLVRENRRLQAKLQDERRFRKMAEDEIRTLNLELCERNREVTDRDRENVKLIKELAWLERQLGQADLENEGLRRDLGEPPARRSDRGFADDLGPDQAAGAWQRSRRSRSPRIRGRDPAGRSFSERLSDGFDTDRRYSFSQRLSD